MEVSFCSRCDDDDEPTFNSDSRRALVKESSVIWSDTTRATSLSRSRVMATAAAVDVGVAVAGGAVAVEDDDDDRPVGEPTVTLLGL